MDLPKSIQEQLKELKDLLKLKKKDMKKLRKLAKKQYKKAEIEPGEAVGVVAAQSLGEPGTQLTLRTKWLAGAREMTITQGLPRLIEIFDARKKPKTPSMNVFLKSSYAKSEKKVEKVSLKILEVVLEDIAEEISVDLIKMRIEIRLDKEKLKYYNLTEKQIQKKISQRYKRYKITTGKLFISVKPKDEDMDVKKLYKFRVKLNNTSVSGIPGITQVLPVKSGEDWIIKTAGSNLKKVLSMQEIDTYKTTSNDLYEILKVLGIEAVRNAIIEETLNVLKSQGIEVDVRHIMLLADLMTANGTLRGIGRYGLSGKKESVLARASFEVPLRHLYNAAMRGERDRLTSVVENVLVNQPAPVGTGMISLKVSKGKTNKKKSKKKTKKKNK